VKKILRLAQESVEHIYGCLTRGCPGVKSVVLRGDVKPSPTEICRLCGGLMKKTS
jgi:hypothetical protein